MVYALDADLCCDLCSSQLIDDDDDGDDGDDGDDDDDDDDDDADKV